MLFGGQPTPLPLANLAVSNFEAAGLIKFEPCTALPLPLQQEMWDKSPLCFYRFRAKPMPDEGHDLSCPGRMACVDSGVFVTSGKFAAIHGHTDIAAI